MIEQVVGESATVRELLVALDAHHRLHNTRFACREARPVKPVQTIRSAKVAAIRDGLDHAGHIDVAILAYAAKFASAFYGPFREAVGSSLQGDRRTYQQDPGNAREAVREIELDLAEGADMVMVKPAMSYLDVVRAAAEMSPVPVAAYQISGEYAMISAAAANGWIDLRASVLESLLSIRRAGADIVLTYWATDVAGWLR